MRSAMRIFDVESMIPKNQRRCSAILTWCEIFIKSLVVGYSSVLPELCRLGIGYNKHQENNLEFIMSYTFHRSEVATIGVVEADTLSVVTTGALFFFVCLFACLLVCFFLSFPYSTFPLIHVPASPPWKHVRSTLNFNAVCKTVSIRHL